MKDIKREALELCREIDKSLERARELQEKIEEIEGRLLKLLEEIDKERSSERIISEFYKDMER